MYRQSSSTGQRGSTPLPSIVLEICGRFKTGSVRRGGERQQNGEVWWKARQRRGRISPLLSVCQVTSPLERKGPSSYPSGYVCDPEEVTALTPERNGRKCVKVREEPGAVPGRQHTLGYTAWLPQLSQEPPYPHSQNKKGQRGYVLIGSHPTN